MVPGPGRFGIWKCWSLRRGENRSTRSTRFPWSLDIFKSEGGLSFMFSILFFFFFHFTRHSAFIELGIYCFSRVVEDFELFLKSVIEKMIIRIPRCFCCVSCPEQPSVLENIYYTICITSPSKEKARTFYLFPFHWCNFFLMLDCCCYQTVL